MSLLYKLPHECRLALAEIVVQGVGDLDLCCYAGQRLCTRGRQHHWMGIVRGQMGQD